MKRAVLAFAVFAIAIYLLQAASALTSQDAESYLRGTYAFYAKAPPEHIITVCGMDDFSCGKCYCSPDQAVDYLEDYITGTPNLIENWDTDNSPNNGYMYIYGTPAKQITIYKFMKLRGDNVVLDIGGGSEFSAQKYSLDIDKDGSAYEINLTVNTTYTYSGIDATIRDWEATKALFTKLKQVRKLKETEGREPIYSAEDREAKADFVASVGAFSEAAYDMDEEGTLPATWNTEETINARRAYKLFTHQMTIKNIELTSGTIENMLATLGKDPGITAMKSGFKTAMEIGDSDCSEETLAELESNALLMSGPAAGIAAKLVPVGGGKFIKVDRLGALLEALGGEVKIYNSARNFANAGGTAGGKGIVKISRDAQGNLQFYKLAPTSAVKDFEAVERFWQTKDGSRIFAIGRDKAGLVFYEIAPSGSAKAYETAKAFMGTKEGKSITKITRALPKVTKNVGVGSTVSGGGEYTFYKINRTTGKLNKIQGPAAKNAFDAFKDLKEFKAMRYGDSIATDVMMTKAEAAIKTWGNIKPITDKKIIQKAADKFGRLKNVKKLNAGQLIEAEQAIAETKLAVSGSKTPTLVTDSALIKKARQKFGGVAKNLKAGQTIETETLLENFVNSISNRASRYANEIRSIAKPNTWLYNAMQEFKDLFKQRGKGAISVPNPMVKQSTLQDIEKAKSIARSKGTIFKRPSNWKLFIQDIREDAKLLTTLKKVKVAGVAGLKVAMKFLFWLWIATEAEQIAEEGIIAGYAEDMEVPDIHSARYAEDLDASSTNEYYLTVSTPSAVGKLNRDSYEEEGVMKSAFRLDPRAENNIFRYKTLWEDIEKGDGVVASIVKNISFIHEVRNYYYTMIDEKEFVDGVSYELYEVRDNEYVKVSNTEDCILDSDKRVFSCELDSLINDLENGDYALLMSVGFSPLTFLHSAEKVDAKFGEKNCNFGGTSENSDEDTCVIFRTELLNPIELEAKVAFATLSVVCEIPKALPEIGKLWEPLIEKMKKNPIITMGFNPLTAIEVLGNIISTPLVAGAVVLAKEKTLGKLEDLTKSEFGGIVLAKGYPIIAQFEITGGEEEPVEGEVITEGYVLFELDDEKWKELLKKGWIQKEFENSSIVVKELDGTVIASTEKIDSLGKNIFINKNRILVNGLKKSDSRELKFDVEITFKTKSGISKKTEDTKIYIEKNDKQLIPGECSEQELLEEKCKLKE